LILGGEDFKGVADEVGQLSLSFCIVEFISSRPCFLIFNAGDAEKENANAETTKTGHQESFDNRQLHILSPDAGIAVPTWCKGF
jgi:hypothetical protein